MFDFASPLTIFYGILTGLVFGFLLQKGDVTRYNVIVGQFLLRDFTVLKVMLTAIVTGALGLLAMRSVGLDVPMHLKPAVLGPVAVGGVIFGVGMALLGYCPGTGVAALGDGSRHAIPGILGMVVGGAIFAEVFPAIQNGFMKAGDVTCNVAGAITDKITFADLLGVSPWLLAGILTVGALILFALLEGLGSKCAIKTSPDTPSGGRTTFASR
ncbi:MAG: YeeE/YedE family protein [Phycisphaeraceae bacterium]|nr:YeeE/YedE family protein [Phycisphaeraceae bacterium]